ncbi:beta-barrel fold lipoprotein [Adhaeribacter aerolatus]
MFLFSCEQDDRHNVNSAGSTYKVVIKQSGDYGNNNKSLIAI